MRFLVSAQERYWISIRIAIYKIYIENVVKSIDISFAIKYLFLDIRAHSLILGHAQSCVTRSPTNSKVYVFQEEAQINVANHS